MLRFHDDDYVLNPPGLLRSLASRLDKFESEYPDAKTGAWTCEVKRVLAAMGGEAQKDIEQLASRTEDGNGSGEFLLDAVWWRRLTPHAVEHIALAVESEFAGWAKNRNDVATEVIKDFEKLLVVKSPLKLMIFCSWYGKRDTDLTPMRDQIWSQLRQCIAQYSHHIEGEKYLFLDTGVLGDRDARIITIPHSGSVSLTKINDERIQL
jgi:hypothetical protein